MKNEVQKQIAKQYDDKMKQNHTDFLNTEKKMKQDIEIIENNAGEKYQKEKELMNQISDMADSSGKSFVEMMAELVKSFKIKPEQK